MTVDLSDLADALRLVLIVSAIVWIIYAWSRRIEYRRAVFVLLAFVVIDIVAHALADFAERPNSGFPSEFPLYSVIVLLAAVAGLIAAWWYTRRVGIPSATLLDAALIAVIAGGIGARAYHVLMRWDYYSQNSDDITNLAQGGMGMRGAISFGIVALFLYALFRSFVPLRVSFRALFWNLADAGALGLAAAQSIGWYGASLVGANYGVVSDSFIARDLPDLYGIIAPRIPVQIIASVFFLILFVVLVAVTLRDRHQLTPGALFLIYLIVASAGGFVLGYYRADETLMVGALRVDQLVDAAFVGIGLLVAGARMLQTSSLKRSEAKG
jgi:phosphatidylglycerol:prolipoprotein diacylglycerol transferase